MNKIALESHLLGAASLGLENVIVLQGDPISEGDTVTQVSDFRATSLINAIRDLNQGFDYRGSKLRSATDFCIGATMDLSRPTEQEVRLAHQKAESGAQFLVTQPVFDADQVASTYQQYLQVNETDLRLPVFWGIQVFTQGGILFSGIPEAVRRQVEAGRDGVEVALEAFASLKSSGEKAFYVIAPILKGGARDYEAAARFLAAAHDV